VNEERAGFELARTESGVAFWIHVSPRSRRPKIGGVHGDALRVAVSEPPVDGAANEGCARALASALGIRRAAVALDPASTGRRKRVRIDGDSEVLAERLLGLASGARAD
jgi:uncharacterized protein YggU (UPF0235/DUF167 family)